MKRVLLLVPEGLTFDMLSEEQQAAINSVFGQYANPMPATIPANGMQIVDAVTADNFDPAVMPQYGIDWPVIGMWTFEGEVLQPLDEVEFMKFLPEGAELHEPHKWAGWPTLFGE